MAQSYEDEIIRHNFQLWDCVGQTPVWGQSRQALISLLPWFHNFQSGFANVTPANAAGHRPACGILLNDYGGNRNYLDTEIAIVSINGPESDAKVTAGRHQAMREAIDNNYLIGIIVARGATNQKKTDPRSTKVDGVAGNILFPGKNTALEDFECFVLDWFRPILMWSEAVLDNRDEGSTNITKTKMNTRTNSNMKTKTVWMVKLQRQNLDQQSWWAAAEHPYPPCLANRDFSMRTIMEQCTTCEESSRVIYNEGFVCFNETCAQGPSHLAGQPMSKDQALTYSNDFLKERNDPRQVTVTGPNPYPQYAPSLQYSVSIPQSWTDDLIKAEMSILLQTVRCPTCGMANVRERWTGWACQNKKCSSPFIQAACPPRLSVQDAMRLCKSDNKLFKDLDLQQYFAENYPNYYQGVVENNLFRVHRFELMDTCKVAVMEPRAGTTQITDGSDHLFIRLQELACNDSRVRLFRRRTRRGFLTSHFNQNFGAPYQMTVATDNTSFAQAPTEIQKAVDQANAWTNPYRDPSDLPFNEMYIAAYLKDQSMSFHQDNERGLNDKILTWSLGGCGIFRIAVQTDICKGKIAMGQEDPLVPGCRKYDERVALKARLSKGEISQEDWETEFKQLMQDDKGTDGREVLRLPTTHGCLVLMYGKNMQTYYQHRMDVVGPMRFALTFRHIGAENQAPSKRKAVSQEDPDMGSNEHAKSTPGSVKASEGGKSLKKSRSAEGSRSASERKTRSTKKA